MQDLDALAKKSECDDLNAYLDQVNPDATASKNAANDPATQAPAKKIDLKTFGDLYGESIDLNRFNTTAAFTQLRYGLTDPKKKLELYGSLRVGGDTRTQLDPNAGIYNDNFLFVGAGVDYVGLVRGVRLRAQVGHSTDLSDKIHRGGFDGMAGVITYHEIPLPKMRIVNEIYSEALYVHRYGNFLANLQTRTLYSAFQSSKKSWTFKLEPMVSTSAVFDSQGLDYNRFVEGKAGVRATLRNRKISMTVTPHYVVGTRMRESNPSYRDFRVLATLYCTLPGKR